MSLELSPKFAALSLAGEPPLLGPKATLRVYSGRKPVRDNTLLLQGDVVLRIAEDGDGYVNTNEINLKMVAEGVPGCFRLTSEDQEIYIEGDVGTDTGDLRFHSLNIGHCETVHTVAITLRKAE